MCRGSQVGLWVFSWFKCHERCLPNPVLALCATMSTYYLRKRHTVLVLWTILMILLATPVGSAPLARTASLPQLFCLGNARIAWSLLQYLSTNYFLHAASIPVGADIGRYTEMVTRKDAFWHRALVSLASLFMPLFALARTIILIAEQLKCTGDDIRAALHHGALLVVVRNPSRWMPNPDGEVVFTKLPEDFDWQCVRRGELYFESPAG